MATHDLTSGVAGDFRPLKGSDRHYVLYKEIDCAVTNLVSGDTYNLFNLPAGALVQCVAYEVTTAEGAADTFDVGYTGSLAAFYNDQSANQTAGTKIGTYVTPLFFATASEVTLLPNAALTAAKLRFWVDIIDNTFI